MGLDQVRSEIERMRIQVGRQRKEILHLQRAGIPTASAELLRLRMQVKIDELCIEREKLKQIFFLAIVGVCSVLVGCSIWWLGRSKSNKAFVGRAFLSGLIIAGLVWITYKVMMWGDDDVFLAFATQLFVVFLAMIFTGYMIVTMSPFIIVRFVLAMLSLGEWYYRYCILNNKLPTMLLFVVLGGAAGIYRIIYH
jgi:hypothetical protein